MLIGLVTAVAVAGPAVVAAVLFGSVQGEEFCSQTFTRRSFRYLQLPLFHVQLMPVRHADTTTPLERRFVTDRYVVPDPTDPPRWDLVYSFRAVGDPVRGDAAILSAALDACDAEGQSSWNAWTDAHPELAKVLWPAIARLARQGLSSFTPELLSRARGAADAQRLRQAIAGALARNYTQLAAIRQRLGEHTEALKLLDEALACVPHDARAERLRDVSRQALGRLAESPPATPSSRSAGSREAQ